jgi:hypothetical protein
MVGSAIVRSAACAALLCLLVVGAATVSAPSAQAESLVRAASVQKAFKAQGITLADATYGMAAGVGVLTSTKLHDGWNVAAYVYKSVGGAKLSYQGNIATWHRSGMAGTIVRNVVIAVVPQGRRIGKKAKPFAIPAAVTRAIATFKA